MHVSSRALPLPPEQVVIEPWQAAMKYVGTPFRHMGRSPNGLDCVGLLMLTARDVGHEPIDNPMYGREPSPDNSAFNLAAYCQMNCGEPVTRNLQPNDILLMRLRPENLPSHLALVAPYPAEGDGSGEDVGMIHTYGEIGRVVYHRIDHVRRSQIVGVYAWPAKH
jgi:cell wall-associated NlpC family hydrolase